MAFEDAYGDAITGSVPYGVYDELTGVYGTVLRQLLPPGPAWEIDRGTNFISDPGGNFQKLLTALGHSYERVVERAVTLGKEYDPDTMFELLDDWERVLGLPGTNPSPATTTAERRDAIRAKLFGNGDPTVAFFVGLALVAGYIVVVHDKQYSPFVAGSPVGDSLTNEGWLFWWTVVYASGDNDAQLERIIESLCPDHTDVGFVKLDEDWIARESPKSYALNGVAHGNGLWVAVGYPDGGDAYLITSPDSVDWTEQTNPKMFRLNSVAYGNGLWVAVGFPDGTDAYIITSPDGYTWTERAPTVSKNIGLNGIAHDGSQFVAVGDADGTDAYILTSPDGITWTERAPTVSKNLTLFGVTWSEALGLFVAVGQFDGTDAYMLTSPDGITWTEQSNPKNISLYGVHAGDDLIVAVGSNDGDAYLITSTDAVSWTEIANPQNTDLYGVTWSDLGSWIAVGFPAGGDAYILTSPDGATWTEQTNPQNDDLKSVAYYNGRIVMVGAADYILSSGLT